MQMAAFFYARFGIARLASKPVKNRMAEPEKILRKGILTMLLSARKRAKTAMPTVVKVKNHNISRSPYAISKLHLNASLQARSEQFQGRFQPIFGLFVFAPAGGKFEPC